VGFLTQVVDMNAHRVTPDLAIMTYGGQEFQIHADHTYHGHPLPALLPEAGARGARIELRLYDTDPDRATARAAAFGTTILQVPENKPHGLRECVILDGEGYAWVPSRALTEEKAQQVGSLGPARAKRLLVGLYMLGKQHGIARVEDALNIDLVFETLLTKIIFEQNHIHTANWRAIRKLCIQADPTLDHGAFVRLCRNRVSEVGKPIAGGNSPCAQPMGHRHVPILWCRSACPHERLESPPR